MFSSHYDLAGNVAPRNFCFTDRRINRLLTSYFQTRPSGKAGARRGANRGEAHQARWWWHVSVNGFHPALHEVGFVPEPVPASLLNE